MAGVSDLSELTCVCSRRFSARVADRLTLGEVSPDSCPLLHVVKKLFDDRHVVGQRAFDLSEVSIISKEGKGGEDKGSIGSGEELALEVGGEGG